MSVTKGVVTQSPEPNGSCWKRSTISLIDCKPEYQGQSRRGEEEIAFHFLADSFLVSQYSKTRSKKKGGAEEDRLAIYC